MHQAIKVKEEEITKGIQENCIRELDIGQKGWSYCDIMKSNQHQYPVATYILFDCEKKANKRKINNQLIHVPLGEESEKKTTVNKQYVHRKLEQKHHKMV